jgi:uncharacterized protein YndB with AHSA1/START domain
MDDAIALEVQLPTTTEATWEILTEPTHLALWFGSHIFLDAKPGGEFREIWTQNGRQLVTDGRIVEFQPPSLIAWTWKDEDWLETTILRLTIKPVNGSLLKLNHSGWGKFEMPLQKRLRAAHEAGWREHLESLARYAASLSRSERPTSTSRGIE